MDEPTTVPPQYKPTPVTDFRHAALGPIGYKMSRKRKMEEYQEQVNEEAAQMEETEVVRIRQPPKRQKLNTVGVGMDSGKPWKEPGERAGSLRNPRLSTSWEKKMADKALLRAFKEAKLESIAARKEKMQKLRAQREAAKVRKEENRRKSMVTQKVTNPATLKKMLKSKKDRKKLMKADTLQSV